MIDGAFDELVEEVQREAEEEAAASVVPRPIHHQRTICRDHARADRRLMEDYFV